MYRRVRRSILVSQRPCGRPVLPRTFLEWGVAVPFTTPLLSSGRVRPGRRGRPEMLMPNPSGGRGLYVFDLAAAPEVTSLTLHDRLLVERLLELPAPSPSEIRKAAQEVAIEGAAGRRAAREASAAADAGCDDGPADPLSSGHPSARGGGSREHRLAQLQRR